MNGRKVAIKIIHDHLAASELAVRRFEEECQALAILHHPGTVPVIDVGWTAGEVYVISEFLLGQSLATLMSTTGPLSSETMRPLLEQLAVILGGVHGSGLAHGRLTPSNIWVVPDEAGAWPPLVRVMDFAMAGLHDGRALASGHLSPEQRRGEPASASSDIYALGAIAYQLLTDRLPFPIPGDEADTDLGAPPRSPRPPSTWQPVPPSADAFVLRALASHPEDRFCSMEEVRESLEDLGDLLSLRGQCPRGSHVDRRLLASDVAEATDDDTGNDAGAPLCRESGPATAGGVTGGAHRIPRRASTSHRAPAWLSAVLGIVFAAVLTVGAYRGLAQAWPWDATSPVRHVEGKMVIVTAPAGATVYLNGVEQVGRTPLTVNGIVPGRPYRVALHRTGYAPFGQTVALGANEEERELRIPLSQAPPEWGTLTLSASTRADFYLDSRKVGTDARRVTLADVRSGTDHELRVTAPGFRPLRQKVRVEPGKVQILELDLEKLP
jgi:hypothetical protein